MSPCYNRFLSLARATVKSVFFLRLLRLFIHQGFTLWILFKVLLILNLWRRRALAALTPGCCRLILFLGVVGVAIPLELRKKNLFIRIAFVRWLRLIDLLVGVAFLRLLRITNLFSCRGPFGIRFPLERLIIYITWLLAVRSIVLLRVSLLDPRHCARLNLRLRCLYRSKHVVRSPVRVNRY